MYNFIAEVFHTIVEASSIIFDLRRKLFAGAKIFELERLHIAQYLKKRQSDNKIWPVNRIQHETHFSQKTIQKMW